MVRTLTEKEKSFNKELEDSLRNAFVDYEADYILVDGHTLRNRFLTKSIQYGLDNGIIFNSDYLDEDEILGPRAGQWAAYEYRLTEYGKKYFGI
jgi:hypothetical protein